MITNLLADQQAVLNSKKFVRCVVAPRRSGKTVTEIVAAKQAMVEGQEVLIIVPDFNYVKHYILDIKEELDFDPSIKYSVVSPLYYITDYFSGGSITIRTYNYIDDNKYIKFDLIIVDEMAYTQMDDKTLRVLERNTRFGLLILSTPKKSSQFNRQAIIHENDDRWDIFYFSSNPYVAKSQFYRYKEEFSNDYYAEQIEGELLERDYWEILKSAAIWDHYYKSIADSWMTNIALFGDSDIDEFKRKKLILDEIVEIGFIESDLSSVINFYRLTPLGRAAVEYYYGRKI